MSAPEEAQPREPDTPPAFDSGFVLVFCGLLIAVYAVLLPVLWRQTQPLYDFSIFWTAGRLAIAGKAAAAYDWASLSQALDAGFARPGPFLYPPVFLILLAPLGALTFAAAAAAWVAINIAAYLAAIRAILPGAATLFAALAAPVVLLNLYYGQNGLLTAGLLGGALAFVDARPLVGGMLMGLLVYKPHFGVLLPFFFSVTGRWRAFAGAALTVAGLVAVAAIAFGWDAFAAYARAMPAAADVYLGQVRVPDLVKWRNLESVVGMLQAMGVANTASWSVHAAIALATIGMTLRIARSGAPYSLQAAMLSTAAVIVTPYSELNDIAILMVPWAFLLRDAVARGSRASEKAAMAAVFLLPLLWLSVRGVVRSLWIPGLASWVGLGPAMCAMLVVLICCRLRPADAVLAARPQPAGIARAGR